MHNSAATVVPIVLLVVVANIGATPQRPPGLPEDDAQLLSQWTSFQRQHDKHYSSPSEASFRRQIFADNLRLVESHNRAADRGLATYRMAINHLSDQLANERPACFRHAANSSLLADAAAEFRTPPGFRAPKSLDWRKAGAVTGVKDQDYPHRCGSCWAFSVTGTLEGQHFRKTGRLVSLSEQDLVDCSKANHGCHGGNPVRAFEFVKQNGGIDTEEAYPYEAVGKKCRFKPNDVGATVRGYEKVPRNNEAKLLEALASVGPISVGIIANGNFQHYSSGVFYDAECGTIGVNHAVLVVGYGRDERTGFDYWLVKNSWGRRWGEHGYVRMARNRDNNCCIGCAASYPLV